MTSTTQCGQKSKLAHKSQVKNNSPDSQHSCKFRVVTGKSTVLFPGMSKKGCFIHVVYRRHGIRDIPFLIDHKPLNNITLSSTSLGSRVIHLPLPTPIQLKLSQIVLSHNIRSHAKFQLKILISCACSFDSKFKIFTRKSPFSPWDAVFRYNRYHSEIYFFGFLLKKMIILMYH